MKVLLFCIAVAGSVLDSVDSALVQERPEKRVIVFTALWKDQPVPITADRELQRILGGGLGDRLDHYSESVDVARFSDEDYQVARREFLARKYVSEARIPVGRTNRLREPGAWDRYRYYIVGVISLLLVQAALIAGLLVQLGRRRRAEASVLESEADLRASHARIRDLVGRLITEQEAERMRIARDLHDDVGQQLALLFIEMEQLAEAVRFGRRDALERTRDLSDRAAGISASVHDLSHQLHPPKLELIGLVVAVAGLRRELSSQHGVAIAFSHANVPTTLPRDVSLCLFRIVQEGLRNAIRHSGAREVCVRLAGDREGLVLTIADQGSGFDVDNIALSGLGLVSMRERLELVGGRLTIRSSPGAGTQLDVIVPLQRAQATG